MVPFLKATIIPIFLTCLAAALEAASALAKGKSTGINRFRVWTEQQRPDGSITIQSIQGLSVHDIQSRNDVIDIERMVSFDVAEFGRLGFELIVAALGIDVIALVDTSTNAKPGGWLVLLGHIVMLVGVVLFYNLSLTVGPDKETERRHHATKAIFIGVFAMMVAFYMS